MPSEKKVSVIMNCYNGEKYLEKAVQTVIDQSYNNWELIFWDNKSTDKSQVFLKKFNDKRIKYFCSDIHTSQYEARKRAVLECDGELLAFLDVDDWWHKDKLMEQVPLFDDPNIGFACCNYWIINERKRKKYIAFKKIYKGNVLERLLIRNFVGMSTLVIRKDAYFSLDYGFNPKFEIIGDYDLVLRLSTKYQLASIKKPLSFYRWHGENLGITKFDLNIKELGIWINDMKYDERFCKARNFNYLIDYVTFYRGLNFILNKDRRRAYREILSINNYSLKLKLFIILFLPIFIIKYLRS